jgi:hypothetical protein
MAALALLALAHGVNVASGEPASTLASDAVARRASLPLLFAAVPGAEGATQFVARGASYGVTVAPDAVRILPLLEERRPIALRFVGANAQAPMRGAGQFAVIHRVQQDPAKSTHTPAYERVHVSSLYPGIDVAFHANRRELEYDVLVAPGADASQVELAFDGIDALHVDDAGQLVLRGDDGVVTLKRPFAYQEIARQRRVVASRFVIAENRARIELDPYDRTHALIIDPVVSYATFIGGTGDEAGTAVAVDAAGNAYVTGYTQATNFPIVNAYDRTIGKRYDVEVFVSKLNAAGTALVWSTYLGGSTGVDRAVGIAVDPAGNVYVTGETSGSDFPTSTSAWQKATTTGGGFVAKLSAAGNALVYSTYVAGATPSAIRVDASGNAYVAGSATSAFVTTANALQPTTRNPTGATPFLLKLNATGSAPIFSTYLGGSGSDDATSLAVDTHGDAYLGGWATSADFPMRDALQPSKRSTKDGFVTKVAGDGSRILYSTFLGGGLDDSVNAIAVDAQGSVYVAGETYSYDFPVKSGFQMQKGGHYLVNSSQGNAFVAKLSPLGNEIVYASFLAGEICTGPCQSVFGFAQTPSDLAYGIGVDSAGHAYVTGLAASWSFPLVDSSAPRKQQDNQDSAFVAKVSISGGTLLWSTFLRTGYNQSSGPTRLPPGATAGVAFDAQDAAYVTGQANDSSGFPVTAGAFQTAAVDPAAIVVKFAAPALMSLTTSSATTDTQTPVTLTATLPGAPTSGNVLFFSENGWLGSASLVGNRASVSLKLSAGIHALSALLQAPGNAVDSPIVSEVVDVPLVCN